jgi:hypothetical protein
MRELLIAEMKRAIEIMEKKPELKRYVKHTAIRKHWQTKEDYESTWHEHDREIVELIQVMHLMRKHSIAIEKQIKEEY